MANNIFCKAFSNHICLTLHNDIRPCCRFDSTKQKEFTRSFKEITNILSDSSWKKASTEFFDTMPGCHKCEQEEITGFKSLRTHFNETSSGKYNRLENIEISLSNECNLKCRMCGPVYSTKWSQEVEENSTLNEFGIYANGKNIHSLEYIEQLNLEYLHSIKYLGGEPFITPVFDELLQLLENRSIIENIELEIDTNCTLFPRKYLNRLSKFKNIHLYFSVDAVGSLGEYIRHGKPWEIIDTTINQWLNSGLDNLYPSIAPTVQAYNICHLPELWEYAKHLDILLSPQFLYHPEFLSVFLLPKKYKEKTIKKLQESTLQNRHKKYFIDTLLSKDHYDIEFDNFIKYTNTLDKIRGESIKKVLPELSEYF